MIVHFIGIGGMGTSALAQYYLSQKDEVSGSDLEESATTQLLKGKGARMFIGPHRAKNLPLHLDRVIYSPAVPPNNPELKKARRLKIRCQSYPQALGELSKKYWTIAVAGTHGKGTTCAMLAKILIRAGLDPTVIIGTKLKEFGNTNFRLGDRPRILTPDIRQPLLLLEADEWKAAFLNYWPQMIVLTNIEKEHMDYYKDLKHILKTYQKFIDHLPQEGILVENKDDPNILRILRPNIKEDPSGSLRQQKSKTAINIQNYSLKQSEAKTLDKILKVPGEHNLTNALAALTSARALNIPDEISLKALSEYKGAWRRFEVAKIALPHRRLLTVISDYAHHPTEIEATVKASRERFPSQPVWVVFQPHQYQRLFYLFDDFVKTFRDLALDKLIITDVFDVTGRETPCLKQRVSARELVRAVKERVDKERQEAIIYLPFSLSSIVHYLKQSLKGGEVVLIMGAGDIYRLFEQVTPLETKAQRAEEGRRRHKDENYPH